MNRLCVIGIVVAILSGCATPLTPEQVQDRRIIDASNWATCQIILSESRIAWTSGHLHRKGRKHRHFEIRQDLLDAQCRLRLGKYWIRYEQR